MCTDWLQRRAVLSPDREAVKDVYTDRSWTYQQLNERAGNLARYFLGKGIQKGDRVCLFSPNHISYLDFLFACAKIGAVFVPLNYRLNIHEINQIIEDCRPSLIGITKEAVPLQSDAIQQVQPLIIDDEYYEHIVHDSSEKAVSFWPVKETDEAVIIYTSGSTGAPKGVVITHEAIIANCLNTIVGWNLEKDDCTVVATPMFHTSGMFGLTTPLLMIGGKVVIQRKFSADEAIQLIEKEKATIVFMVPTMYYLLTKSPYFYQSDLSAVKAFISGGAPCQQHIHEIFEKRGLPFKESYGLTEAGPNNFYIDPFDPKRKKGSVGKPILFSHVELVNDEGKAAKTGEVGEIVLSGKNLFKCYWNKKEETENALKNHKLYTGDLARKDEDGYYYIVGRKKDMIISGGENIYPFEVEHVLNSYPRVEHSVVVGVPDEKWGEIVAAMIATPDPQSLSEQELQDYCRMRIARYKVPRKFLFVKKLPLNDVGKVDKKRIKEIFLQNQSEATNL